MFVSVLKSSKTTCAYQRAESIRFCHTLHARGRSPSRGRSQNGNNNKQVTVVANWLAANTSEEQGQLEIFANLTKTIHCHIERKRERGNDS